MCSAGEYIFFSFGENEWQYFSTLHALQYILCVVDIYLIMLCVMVLV